MKETLLIKLWGGPGIGKTTTALRLAGELSIQVGPEKSVEYVGEYAKKLIWENRIETLSHQPTVTRGQLSLLSPIGQCDFIVTDSPIEMGLLYASPEHMEETKSLILAYNAATPHRAINILLARDRNDFQEEGRVHTLMESMEIDRKIIEMFEGNEMPYIKVSNTISPTDLCRMILQDHA